MSDEPHGSPWWELHQLCRYARYLRGDHEELLGDVLRGTLLRAKREAWEDVEVVHLARSARAAEDIDGREGGAGAEDGRAAREGVGVGGGDLGLGLGVGEGKDDGAAARVDLDQRLHHLQREGGRGGDDGY